MNKYLTTFIFTIGSMIYTMNDQQDSISCGNGIVKKINIDKSKPQAMQYEIKWWPTREYYIDFYDKDGKFLASYGYKKDTDEILISSDTARISAKISALITNSSYFPLDLSKVQKK